MPPASWGKSRGKQALPTAPAAPDPEQQFSGRSRRLASRFSAHSYLLLSQTITSFLTVVPPLQRALRPVPHKPHDLPRFIRRPLILGLHKALSSSCRWFLSQKLFYDSIKMEGSALHKKHKMCDSGFQESFSIGVRISPNYSLFPTGCYHPILLLCNVQTQGFGFCLIC